MRDVYIVSAGLTKFVKADQNNDYREKVREAFEYAKNDVKIKNDDIDGSVCAYFSDHVQGQLLAGVLVNDYIGLAPKPSKRIEGGGATGGLAVQAGYEEIASGNMDVCAVYGFENLSRLTTWKGNEVIALASDINFDFPLGGFYTAYYALMATRHMYEFGTTVEQMAMVSVKNHGNAIYNKFAQSPMKLTVDDVRKSPMVSTPLTRLDICNMSDGAACLILASKDKAYSITDKPVKIEAIGSASDTLRLADRPFGEVPLLPNENKDDYKNLRYPGVHSFRAGRLAAIQAYKRANIKDPLNDIDFAEVYDSYTSAEIQAYEDLGFCKYGEGGKFIESGSPMIDGDLPVNASGGLLASGHAIGATGIMQAVYAFWQIQGRIERHLGSNRLQVKNANRGVVHSHAGTGAYETVTILKGD
ncbi:thiolase domain-containing protein [Picrophilus oshimae]|uniref:Beta-ketoacyl synthase n=1 Tax=Picrophilus torridus (strain ATCC 700027 / DSM 9790 / JCM 10055 / NBRC 100828 / KAW 2/3) TaxID=1122961 RepID=Q6KZS9_PICTO|nr:thiolase domain-containing protein [Picrophilus oshimae]AAT43773.1 beta-ketoacyl synthase [Picrophilus oshimae DSM 9789]